MNSEDKTQKRALVIRAGRLGDTVWGTTVLEPIRAFLGEQTQIDIIITRGMRTLFEHDPRIGTIFEIDHRNIPLLFSPTKLSVLCKSLKHPYDLVVNLETSSHFSSLMRFVRATQKICTSTLPPHENRPDGLNVVNFLSYVLSQGVPANLCQNAAPSLRSPELTNIADLIGNDRDYLCLHPGNSLLARGKPALRSWPKSCWQELIKQIIHRFPTLQIVLIGEKSEQELSTTIAANHPGVINLAGRTSLPQLMTLLAHSRALITTDTGPAHVAAALATPVIAIFGPSEAYGTGPIATTGGWAVSVMKNIGCNPCVNTERAKTCTDNKCMLAITPSDIVIILEDALQKRSSAPVIELDTSSNNFPK